MLSTTLLQDRVMVSFFIVRWAQNGPGVIQAGAALTDNLAITWPFSRKTELLGAVAAGNLGALTPRPRQSPRARRGHLLPAALSSHSYLVRAAAHRDGRRQWPRCRRR